MRAIRTEAEIDAPPSRVWSLIADTRRWGEWSDVMKCLDADLAVGTRGKLTIEVKGRELNVPVQIQRVDAERELRWGGGLPGLVRASHFLRLEPLAGERTRLVHGERFEGPLVRVLWPVLSRDLEARYQRFCRSLKAAAES